MLASTLVRFLTLDSDLTNLQHLSAASGLCWLGNYLYVVADDSLHLGVFSESQSLPGHLYRLLPGELPSGHKERKKAKPDFEVLAYWANYSGAEGGALLALGSGSKSNRCNGVVIPLDANYGIMDKPFSFDLAPIYSLLAPRFPDLNIEGAVIQSEELWLFHRGNSEGGKSALIMLPISALHSCLERVAPDANDPVIRVKPLELGTRDGVALTVTDATRLADGCVLFTAAAENTSNTYDDGECAGSVMGMLSPTGEMLWSEPLSGQDKVEGIACKPDETGLTCLLVTDADSENIAAKLLKLRLPTKMTGQASET